MVFNQLDIHLLITAICVISSALICYTIGVWGEHFQGTVKSVASLVFCIRTLCGRYWNGLDGAYRPADPSA